MNALSVLRAFATLFALVAWALSAHPAPKEELHELRGRIDRLQHELSGREESRSEAADALKASEQAISIVNRKLHELAVNQKRVDAALTSLRADSTALRARIREQQALLERLIQQRYVNGGGDSIKLILNGQDPADLSRQLHYYGYISRARSDAVQELRTNLTRLEAIETETRMKAGELASIHTEQMRGRQQLEKDKLGRKQLLAQLSGQISTQRREIDRLKLDERRLTRLVDELARMLARKRSEEAARVRKKRDQAAQPGPRPRIEQTPDASFVGVPFQSLKGKLRLPVKGELLNRFGGPRQEGGLTWKGLFIRAGDGDPVKAVADGRVVFADWLRGFGNLLILDHGDGFMSLYGNNEAILKHVGDPIRVGEVVAAVGNSGGNPDSGLYFELRHQSKPFDPMDWVGR